MQFFGHLKPEIALGIRASNEYKIISSNSYGKGQAGKGCHGSIRQGLSRVKPTRVVTGQSDKGCQGSSRQGLSRVKLTKVVTGQVNKGCYGSS